MFKLKFGGFSKLVPIGEVTKTIDCESCGCMVKKEKSVKGKSEVRTKPIYCDAGFVLRIEEEEIFTPYYCKRCAKEKGSIKNEIGNYDVGISAIKNIDIEKLKKAAAEILRELYNVNRKMKIREASKYTTRKGAKK
jgi:hypothetical protein